jgi:hypothetical protein
MVASFWFLMSAGCQQDNTDGQGCQGGMCL